MRAMDPKALLSILENHAGCKADGKKQLVSQGVEVTVFAATGDETLVIGPVRDVIVDGDVAILGTTRGDLFAVLCRDVRAVKIGGSDARAGYGTR